MGEQLAGSGWAVQVDGFASRRGPVFVVVPEVTPTHAGSLQVAVGPAPAVEAKRRHGEQRAAAALNLAADPTLQEIFELDQRRIREVSGEPAGVFAV